jgi:hypothetical protein
VGWFGWSLDDWHEYIYAWKLVYLNVHGADVGYGILGNPNSFWMLLGKLCRSHLSLASGQGEPFSMYNIVQNYSMRNT